MGAYREKADVCLDKVAEAIPLMKDPEHAAQMLVLLGIGYAIQDLGHILDRIDRRLRGQERRTCPNYERARREEAEAVQRGELKFPGIGLASEDREHLERQLRLRGKRTVSPRGEGVDSGSPQSPTTPERRDEA